MADPAPTGTVVPAPQGGGSPEFKVPDGKMLIDATEHQRATEKLAGYTRFHGEASKRGFAKPEDFGRYDKLDGVLKGKNLSMDQMVAILEAKEESGGDKAANGLDPAALDKLLTDRGYVTSKALDEREALIGAKFSHKEAIAKEQSLMEKHVEELTGEKATPFQKAQIKAMLRGMADEKRTLYPDNHPLSKLELAAHDEKSLGAIVAEIKKMRGDAEGESLAELGKAAAKGVSTPAGSSASMGKAKKEDDDDTQTPTERVHASIKRAKAEVERG